MNQIIKKIQDRFKHRVTCLRQRQIAAAKERAVYEKFKWQAMIAERQRKEFAVVSSLCPDCDWPFGIGRDVSDGVWITIRTCRCHSPLFSQDVVKILRKLAGINYRRGQHKTIHHEFTDALKGAAGPRGCDADAWDNAMRSIEEDR